MLLPEEFPYISSIFVKDCFAYQNFNIELKGHQPFSHLILTGKNGSGKSTILRNLNLKIQSIYDNSGENFENDFLNRITLLDKNGSQNKDYKDIINNLLALNIQYFQSPKTFNKYKNQIINSYLLPYRNSKVTIVETPTNQDVFQKQLEENNNSSEFITKHFTQFLVNKKVNQAFAQIENNTSEISNIDYFFNQLENVFKQIFEDSALKLLFIKESYQFIISLSEGRKVTFDLLPDGFSAFLSIIMDLFVRQDLIRKEVKDFTYNPCGIVLIDEPETHLHLSLQYQVLPILTTLFPNIQFVVATHSPAVISSIKNVTVFDITSKESLSDEAVGKSFSELMVSHFGLDNEFSGITDKLFEEANNIIRKNNNNQAQLNDEIKKFIAKNELYISPAMRFELEAKLFDI